MRHTRREARRAYECWIAGRCKRAADDLHCAADYVNELKNDACRPKTLFTAEAADELARLEREIRALRARVIAISPMPIADED